MFLPLPSGKWVNTGGGVDRLLTGDSNVRVIERPAEPLGLKAYWHINPLEDLFGSLVGKRILDIGCCTGYVSVLAAKRGANVVATEMHDENIQRTELVVDTFDLAHKITIKKTDMQTMTDEEMGRFDAVLFLGTIYHCEHPQEVLNRIAQMSDTIVVDGRMATQEQVNERIGGLEFFTDTYDDKPQLGSIRRVGGGVLRKPTRKTLWQMLKNSGFNTVHQTMPYEGMGPQFQSEGFVQFVARKSPNVRQF